MPQTTFLFYADSGNVAPVIAWLDEQPEKVQEKILVAIRMLSAQGYEARRPLWAPLQNDIYELRVRHQNVNYRLLCFFHGRQAIVAAHSCTKERAVDPADIKRATTRMAYFRKDPKKHTYTEKLD